MDPDPFSEPSSPTIEDSQNESSTSPTGLTRDPSLGQVYGDHTPDVGVPVPQPLFQNSQSALQLNASLFSSFRNLLQSDNGPSSQERPTFNNVHSYDAEQIGADTPNSTSLPTNETFANVMQDMADIPLDETSEIGFAYDEGMTGSSPDLDPVHLVDLPWNETAWVRSSTSDMRLFAGDIVDQQNRLKHMHTLFKYALGYLDTPCREKVRSAHDSFATTSFSRLSSDTGATVALLYDLQASPTGSNVWPDVRQFSSTPARLTVLSAIIDVQCPKTQDLVKSITSAKPDISRRPPKPIRSSAPQQSKFRWPQYRDTLPQEVYELIVQHLARDDLKALRLTCKEIEYRISHILFETVVVAFNPEIYGMLQFTNHPSANQVQAKGKGKAKDAPDFGSPEWSDFQNTGKAHALDVFRGFGPHMKRFGMSYEIDEEHLSSLPPKELLQKLKSYWGEYDWPYPDYQRFVDVAQLEDTADETPLMVKAFSFLTKVEELSLSIDSGLGRLHGPDVNLYHRIRKQPSPVFRTPDPLAECGEPRSRKAIAQKELWKLLKRLHGAKHGDAIAWATVRHALLQLPSSSFDAIHAAMKRVSVMGNAPILSELSGILDFVRNGAELRHLMDILTSDVTATSNADSVARHEGVQGILAFDTNIPDINDLNSNNFPLRPNRLTKPQREWLMETEWAQRAFISSYILAVIDNAFAFRNVHTVNLARLSGHYIPQISRQDFWDSLPNVKIVTILAVAEWREVSRDEAGSDAVEVKPILPTTACIDLEVFLMNIVAPRRQITTLNVGWASGGEQERGTFGRNQHLMPAPIMPWIWIASSMATGRLVDEMILFPFIQNLTLTNCWVIPTVLQLFMKSHSDMALESLTLDSVSLSPNMSSLNPVLSANPPRTTVDQNQEVQQVHSVYMSRHQLGALFTARTISTNPPNQAPAGQLAQVAGIAQPPRFPGRMANLPANGNLGRQWHTTPTARSR